MRLLLLSTVIFFVAQSAAAQFTQGPTCYMGGPYFSLCNVPGIAPDLYSLQLQAKTRFVAWNLLGPPASNLSVYRSGGAISRTTNGGSSWSYYPLPASLSVFNMDAQADGNTAYITTVQQAYYPDPVYSQVLKTTNAGQSWTPLTDTTHFAANEFAEWARFFSTSDGMVIGDDDNGNLKGYTTLNGGATWQRIPATDLPPPMAAGEYISSYGTCTWGDTLWAGTMVGYASGSGASGRSLHILRSVDRGRHWTISGALPALRYDVRNITFMTPLLGLACDSQGHLVRTTDGGLTWQTVVYQGSFPTYCVRAMQSQPTVLVAVGHIAGGVGPNDFAYAYSIDAGTTWRSLLTGYVFFTIDIIDVSIGFAGAYSTSNGPTGFYTVNSSLLPTAAATPAAPFLIYPNPSTTGQFTVQLPASVKTGPAVLRVLDALGREVDSHTVAQASGLQLPIDLSRQPSGVYVLQLNTTAGSTQQKLVIQ